jgi:hypothetical protein
MYSNAEDGQFDRSAMSQRLSAGTLAVRKLLSRAYLFFDKGLTPTFVASLGAVPAPVISFLASIVLNKIL